MHARRHPRARLERWWSEATATARFRTIKPDGHGLWSIDGTAVGYWLEVDTGSEPLGKVVAKLDNYASLARVGSPRYPVLFWLHSTEREKHLHPLLRGRRADVTAATAMHDTDPAEKVWLPAGATQRVALVELPSDHGQSVAVNANFDDDGVFVP